jgi:hypothetical protein
MFEILGIIIMRQVSFKLLPSIQQRGGRANLGVRSLLAPWTLSWGRWFQCTPSRVDSFKISFDFILAFKLVSQLACSLFLTKIFYVHISHFPSSGLKKRLGLHVYGLFISNRATRTKWNLPFLFPTAPHVWSGTFRFYFQPRHTYEVEPSVFISNRATRTKWDLPFLFPTAPHVRSGTFRFYFQPRHTYEVKPSVFISNRATRTKWDLPFLFPTAPHVRSGTFRFYFQPRHTYEVEPSVFVLSHRAVMWLSYFYKKAVKAIHTYSFGRVF